MRIFKLALYSIIFFFLLVTIISLFIPSRVRISKAIDINASRSEVMTLIKDPARWKEWYPGGDSLAPLMVYGIQKGLVLDSMKTWVILLDANDSIVNGIVSGENRNVKTRWEINGVHPVTLQWYLDFKLKWYPWEKFSSLFFEKVYGDQLERGLESLRQRVETARQ